MQAFVNYKILNAIAYAMQNKPKLKQCELLLGDCEVANREVIIFKVLLNLQLCRWRWVKKSAFHREF